MTGASDGPTPDAPSRIDALEMVRLLSRARDRFKPLERDVLYYLIGHFNYTRSVWPYPSQASMARNMHAERARVRSALHELQRRGYVTLPKGKVRFVRAGGAPERREIVVNWRRLMADLAHDKRAEDAAQSVTESVTMSVTETESFGLTHLSLLDSPTCAQGTHQPCDLEPCDSEPYEFPPVCPPMVFVSDSDIREAVRMWNAAAITSGLTRVEAVQGKRRSDLKTALRELGGLEAWGEVLRKVERSPFLCGDNDREWRATLGWVVKAKNRTRILEGSFDKHSRRIARTDELLDEFHRNMNMKVSEAK